jgi:hypothetical protein
LHELPHPLKAVEHLSGWNVGPLDVLGDHLREDAIEGTLVKQRMDILDNAGVVLNRYRYLLCPLAQESVLSTNDHDATSPSYVRTSETSYSTHSGE